MPQDIPVTYDVHRKRFSMDYTLISPRGSLIMEQHNYAVKEWDSPGSQALTHSAIFYGLLINSTTVWGKRGRVGAWRAGETAIYYMDIDGYESQEEGRYRRTSKGGADMGRRL